MINLQSSLSQGTADSEKNGRRNRFLKAIHGQEWEGKHYNHFLQKRGCLVMWDTPGVSHAKTCSLGCSAAASAAARSCTGGRGEAGTRAKNLRSLIHMQQQVKQETAKLASSDFRERKFSSRMPGHPPFSRSPPVPSLPFLAMYECLKLVLATKKSPVCATCVIS